MLLLIGFRLRIGFLHFLASFEFYGTSLASDVLKSRNFDVLKSGENMKYEKN